MKELTFGHGFNQLIILTKYIKILTLGLYFDQSIILTSNIMVLTIGCNNHMVIDNLSNDIKHITLDYRFKLNLNNVPNNMEKIPIVNLYT